MSVPFYKFHFWEKDVFNFLPGTAISGSKEIKRFYKEGFGEKQSQREKTDKERLT